MKDHNFNLFCYLSRNKKWKHVKSINYQLQYGKSIVHISQLDRDLSSIVCIRDRQRLLVNISRHEAELCKITSIDCLDILHHSICLSVSSKPQSALIGTGDGHSYQLFLESGVLVMLYDLQQPVVSIIPTTKHLIIVGKYGKIVKLDIVTKQAVATAFAPTAITSCLHAGNQLYVQGPTGVLYSLELKKDSLGAPLYCKVKFVRRFHLTSQSLLILTEDSSIYETSLHFGTEENGASVEECSGSEIKTIIQQIHQCTDRVKELGKTNEEIRQNISQLSIALEMIGSDHTDKFPTLIRSYACDDGSERLRISITNSSPWNFLSSHWTCNISVHLCNHSAVVLDREWKSGQTFMLEHRLKLDEETFCAQIRVSLVFRAVDPFRPSEPQPVCLFPLSSVTLNVLDFIEPSTQTRFDDKKILTEVLGFVNINTPNPWQSLFQRSYHRGFSQLLPDFVSEVIVRCGSYPVRMALKEEMNQSGKIWILRVDAMNEQLLNLLRVHMFTTIRSGLSSLTENDVIQIPAHVLAHLQVIIF